MLPELRRRVVEHHMQWFIHFLQRRHTRASHCLGQSRLLGSVQKRCLISYWDYSCIIFYHIKFRFAASSHDFVRHEGN